MAALATIAGCGGEVVGVERHAEIRGAPSGVYGNDSGTPSSGGSGTQGSGGSDAGTGGFDGSLLGSPRCNPQCCPTGGAGVSCCAVDGTCGKDYGVGCVSNAPAAASCDPASCPTFGEQKACCLNGFCALDWGSGCGIEPTNRQNQCDPAPEDLCGGDNSVRSCGCAWLECSVEMDYCANDTTWQCDYIMICESQTNCVSADCYKPETCQGVIDSHGGPTGLAAMMAQAVNDCLVRSGCAFGVQ
jgi:hypothetical protein